jgi:succinate dehydrogenase assembly factor 1
MDVGKLTTSISYRAEFDKNITIDKKNFGAIEYLLRKGQRQMEIYAAPGIKNIVH